MAQATLREMGREVHLYSGGVCPITLAERWVRDRYRHVTSMSLWSFKIGQGQFGTLDSYSTGTVTMTYNSTTVTGSSTVFTSDMVGRQFKVSGFVFTIATFSSTTSITIDRAWLNATEASLTYEIVTAYITPSDSDFFAFYSVLDPANGWLLRTGFSTKDLDRIDAMRSSGGTPRILATQTYNTSGAIRYELWPHPTSQAHYPYIYEKDIADLSAATDTPPVPVGSDLLVKGALADLCRWPGTPERRNPMYDPYFQQYRSRETEFKEDLEKAIVEDQSRFMTDLTWGTDLRYAPIDARFQQNHAY